jgi:hypothetical protein
MTDALDQERASGHPATLRKYGAAEGLRVRGDEFSPDSHQCRASHYGGLYREPTGSSNPLYFTAEAG